ncbi:TPA: hypothetical protein DEW05_00610 [Candidatus Saccharibacteria bacterium]|nr:hypothetical protein [Candidatus Saccharibacteria bacterium]
MQYPAGYSYLSRTESILKLLKEIRAERGLSVKELAILSKVSPPTIYKIETDTHCPHESTLAALAEALDIKLNDVLLPKGSTNLGKPAQSSGRTTPNSQKRYGEHCDTCHEDKSLSGNCICTD